MSDWSTGYLTGLAEAGHGGPPDRNPFDPASDAYRGYESGLRDGGA